MTTYLVIFGSSVQCVTSDSLIWCFIPVKTMGIISHYSCPVPTRTHARTSLLTPAVAPVPWRMQTQAGMQSQTFLHAVSLHLMLQLWGAKQSHGVTHSTNTHLLRWLMLLSSFGAQHVSQPSAKSWTCSSQHLSLKAFRVKAHIRNGLCVCVCVHVW